MLLVLNKRMADLFKNRKNQSAVSVGTYNKLRLVSSKPGARYGSPKMHKIFKNRFPPFRPNGSPT